MFTKISSETLPSGQDFVRQYQKTEDPKAFDYWLVVFAGIALCISAGLVWVSKGGIPPVGIALIIVLIMACACSIFLKELDWALISAAQIALGMQLLPALLFEQRPALFGGLMAVAVLPVMIWLSIIHRHSIRIFDYAGYFLILGGFFACNFAPMPKGVIPFLIGDSDYFLLGVIIASLVIGYMLRRGLFRRDTILSAVGISGVLLVSIAVIQDFFGSDGSVLGHRLALSAPIGPNLLAFCLDISMPITIGVSLAQENRFKKILFMVFGGIQLVALIMTGTRGSIVTLAAVLIWIVFRARTMKYFWVIMPPIFTLILSVIIQKTISRLVSSSPEELLSHLGRFYLIRTAWSMLSQGHYLWGIGVDRFSSLKFEYGFPIWFNPTKSMSTHNTYLEYWLGWGGAGVLGYITVLIRALLPQRGIKSNEITTGLKIAISGIAFHGFVDSALVAYSFTFTLWIVLACSIFGVPNQGAANPSKESSLRL